MKETVAHPVVVQLIPRRRRAFRNSADFVLNSIAVRVFAFGSEPGEVSENAAMALAKAIGRRRWRRYEKVATCYFAKDVEWSRSYLVEDWSRQHGKIWVKRYWAHAPSAEIAAWAARAEISAAAGRERQNPELLSYRDPMAPNACLGWRTTVHEFSDVRGLVCPHYAPKHALEGYRAAMMVAISNAERRGVRPADHYVAQALGETRQDMDLLYSRVSYAPAERSLRRSGAGAYSIAREIALEKICDEFARSIKQDAESLDKYQAFFAAIHGWLITPIGSNLTDIGPAEPAERKDLRACLQSETLAADMDHQAEPSLDEFLGEGAEDDEAASETDSDSDFAVDEEDLDDDWEDKEEDAVDDSDDYGGFDGDGDCDSDSDWRE